MRGMKKSWKILTTRGSKMTTMKRTMTMTKNWKTWRHKGVRQAGGQCSGWDLMTMMTGTKKLWKTWRHKGVWLSDGSFDQRINAISSPTLIMEPIRSIASDQGPFQKLSRVDIVSSWSFTSWEFGTKRKIGGPQKPLFIYLLPNLPFVTESCMHLIAISQTYSSTDFEQSKHLFSKGLE